MGIYVLISLFSFVKIADRPVQNIQLSSQTKQEIQTWNQDSIIEKSLELTCRMLQFSTKNNIKEGKANCVGYAQLYTSICNYAFARNNKNAHATPVVGYIKLGDFNLCNIAKSLAPNIKWKNFVKDHDFVEITINGKIQYVDPSLYDYFKWLYNRKS